MSKTVNILLTYPSDNITQKWLDVFFQKLKMALSRTLPFKVNWDIRSDITDIYKSTLSNYQIFIVILDQKDNNNKEFQKHLESLTEYLEDNDSLCADSKKIIKILRSPNNICDQPLALKPISGYNFYEFLSNKNNSVLLDFENTDQNVKAWKLILDLAYDLKSNQDYQKEDKKNNFEKKVVYLSPCSTDLISVRDEISRELINRNFKVLPSSNSIPDIEEFEEATLNSLAQSFLVIQLLGAKYGNTIKGKSGSYLELENNIINKSLESGNHFKRVIWVPNSIKRFESKQEFFISRIKKKITDNNFLLYNTSKDEFKELLLNSLKSDSPETIKKTDSKNLIYLITPDSNTKNDFEKELVKNQLNVVSLSDKNNQNAYKEHLNNITKSDHILIYWKNHDSFWLNSKMSDLIKAPGLGKQKPFKSITIFTNGLKPDISGFAPWLPEVTCMSEDNPKDLVEYLAHIKDNESDER